MPANIQSQTDLFAERHFAWTEGVEIYYQNQTMIDASDPAVHVGDQEVADGPIALVIADDATITITWIDSAGDRQGYYSQQDGDDTTWT